MINEDYLPCSSYENQLAHAVESGFLAFYDEPSSRFFFSMVDADGKVLLKSEGYPQQAVRENGIQSVIRNRGNKDFYSVKSEDGKYYLSLRAANYREIARSCSCDSEADALALIPYLTGEKIRGGVSAAMAEPKERANDKVDDDYLACKEYAGHPDVGMDGYPGLVKFTHTNGNHYFAWYDEDNDLLMRSEGYPTTAARDNGMASVAKNRDLEARYSVFEKFGRYFTILKAGNHQEIARSCAHDTEGGALALFPGERARLAAEKTAAMAAASVAAGVASVAPESERREDNYLACKEYENKGTADENGIVKWQHPNGEYYFTWVDDGGQVLMRSEGYPTAAARDNGAASVIKNRDIKERYETVEKHGKYFMMLKAGNHQEIARSCPKEDKALFAAWFPALGLLAAVPAIDVPEVKAEPMAAVIETPPVVVAKAPAPAEVEDDYLPCREYEGHHVNDKQNNVAMFKHSNGQYYFAIYNADGSVRIRSEGFSNALDRDKELSGVLRNINNPDMYTTTRKGDYYITILKDKTGREVGRSCLQKDKPVIIVPPILAPAAAATAVAAAAALFPTEEVEEPKVVVPPPPVYESATAAAPAAAGGFNWWWLLLPLLALLAYFLWTKGCNKETVAVAPLPTPTISAPVDTPAKNLPAIPSAASSGTAAAPSCDLAWIFFDFDKSDLRAASQTELDEMAKILKDNPDYVAVLKANTDGKGSDDYNIALSNRRAAASKAFIVNKGIDASRIKTSINGEKDPIAKNAVGNQDSEQGRQYNRRVELYIQDKTGKNICESIPPAVPSDLKVKN